MRSWLDMGSEGRWRFGFWHRLVILGWVTVFFSSFFSATVRAAERFRMQQQAFASSKTSDAATTAPPGATSSPSSQSSNDDSAWSSIRVAPASDSWRALLPLDPEAATDAYLARLSGAVKARSDAYFEGGYWLQLWAILLSLAFTALWLMTGFSASLRARIEAWTRRPALRVMTFVAFYLLISQLLFFPFTVYAGYFREHAYGLLNQSFFPWLNEQLIGLLLVLVLLVPLISVLYWLARKKPESWHQWGCGVSLSFFVLMILLGPVFIDPLFNRYQPVEAGPARDAVLSMARANGIPATEVFQFDASKQSDRVSANVAGFLGTTSIRLNDNLLHRSSLPEIKGVMGHEMGHYVLNHVYKMILEFGLVIFAGFAFMKWGLEWFNRRYGARWGLRGVADVAGLPLAAALLGSFMFLMTPVLNTMVRTQEAEADIFGINASRSPDGFAEAQLKLIEYRKSNPGPIEEFIFFDHPSPRKRILAAMRWKAENVGQGRVPGQPVN